MCLVFHFLACFLFLRVILHGFMRVYPFPFPPLPHFFLFGLEMSSSSFSPHRRFVAMSLYVLPARCALTQAGAARFSRDVFMLSWVRAFVESSCGVLDLP